MTVKAVSSVSDPIQVVVAPGPPSGEDFLTSTYAAGMGPNAVVVNGVRSTLGGPCGVTLFPYVAGSSLGNLVNPCSGADGGWGAAVLSKDHSLTFMSDPWTVQQDKLDAGPARALFAPIPLAVRIMVGDDDAASEAELSAFRQDVLVTARDDIAAANGVLTDTRTGLQLVEVNAVTIETAENEAAESGDVTESGKSHGERGSGDLRLPGGLCPHLVARLPRRPERVLRQRAGNPSGESLHLARGAQAARDLHQHGRSPPVHLRPRGGPRPGPYAPLRWPYRAARWPRRIERDGERLLR